MTARHPSADIYSPPPHLSQSSVVPAASSSGRLPVGGSHLRPYRRSAEIGRQPRHQRGGYGTDAGSNPGNGYFLFVMFVDLFVVHHNRLKLLVNVNYNVVE